MTQATDRLSTLEKVGYSLGDLAANLIFQTLMTFLAFFYTDVYGISPAAASSVIFIGGMIGAFFNPVMGLIADRTQTRWGRFRPWILWTSIPFGVIALLTFSTPNLSGNAKVAYAFITYTLLVVIYSANNLPYAALSGVMTGNMAQRNSLSAYRFVAVMVAQFIIQVLLLPLVLILGDGDQAVGFKNTMTMFAIIGTVFFLITFVTTRERIAPTTVEQRSTVKEDLKDLFGNRPWLIMLLVTVLVFITLALKSGTYIYYFKDYLNEPQLAAFLSNSGFNGFIAGMNNLLTSAGMVEFRWPEDPATSAFSLFNACGILMMIVGIGFSKPLADRFGKRDVYSVALSGSALCLLVFIFFPPDAIGPVFLAQTLHGFIYGITIPLLWAMIADVADYSEWRNHRRATAIIFSAMIFGLKAGLSVGGSLVALLLGFYGYSAELAEQGPETIDGIRVTVSIFSALPFFSCSLLLLLYPINRPMERTIESALAERRAAPPATL